MTAKKDSGPQRAANAGGVTSGDSDARARDARSSRWAFAALIGGNVALSLGPMLVRLADTGPVASAFWRMAIALPLILLLARRETGGRMPPRPAMLTAAIAGLFFAFDLMAWHIGILQTKVANATLFGNCTSLLLVLWGVFLTRTLPRGWQAVAILLAFAGSALLMGQSYDASPANLAGDLLCLLAGLFYTFYVILMQRVRDTLAPWTTLGIASAACLPLLLGMSLTMGEALMPRDWTPLILLALVSQLTGQGLMIWSLPRFSPPVIGLTLLVQPAFAALTGWLAFNERLGPIDIFGGMLVGAALVLIRLPSRQSRPI
jgi:drug/metabolite transporter (DMT)-like permease